MIVKEHRHERPKSQSCGSFNDAILTDVKFLNGPVYGGQHAASAHWVRDNVLRRVRNFSCFRSVQAWGVFATGLTQFVAALLVQHLAQGRRWRPLARKPTRTLEPYS
jgi:hypothetical protein